MMMETKKTLGLNGFDSVRPMTWSVYGNLTASRQGKRGDFNVLFVPLRFGEMTNFNLMNDAFVQVG